MIKLSYYEATMENYCLSLALRTRNNTRRQLVIFSGIALYCVNSNSSPANEGSSTSSNFLVQLFINLSILLKLKKLTLTKNSTCRPFLSFLATILARRYQNSS